MQPSAYWQARMLSPSVMVRALKSILYFVWSGRPGTFSAAAALAWSFVRSLNPLSICTAGAAARPQHEVGGDLDRCSILCQDRGSARCCVPRAARCARGRVPPPALPLAPCAARDGGGDPLRVLQQARGRRLAGDACTVKEADARPRWTTVDLFSLDP